MKGIIGQRLNECYVAVKTAFPCHNVNRNVLAV
jgi:hypothetical protein